MALNIFSDVVGEGDIEWPRDTESQALLAVKVLDRIQVVADMLTDSAGVRYKVSFADLDTAYSDHLRKAIVISAKPMVQGGRPIAAIIEIMTGFAVHEVGHTKERELAFSKLVRAEWPGKVTPQRLGNILGDVRLEAAIVARFNGLRDVFIPTMTWVSDQLQAERPEGTIMAWGKTLHERLNFVGAAVRYSHCTEFGTDPETVSQLAWWQDWGAVDDGTDNDVMIQRVRDGIARIREGAEHAPEPEPEGPVGPPPEGPVCPPPVPTEPKGMPPEGNPDNDFPEGEDEPKGEPNGETNGGDTEGEGEGEPEGEPKGDEPKGTEGEDGDGKGDKGGTLDRTEAPAGTNDQHGSGGTGKAVSDSLDDPDEGLDEELVEQDQDGLTESEPYDRQARTIQMAVDEERSSSRLDAGAYGTMKVKVKL